MSDIIKDDCKDIMLRNDTTIKWRNEAVNGKYTMTLMESRMVIALAAQIDKNSDDFDFLSISAKELGEFMQVGEENLYAVIKNTAKKLFARVLYFEEIVEDKKKNKKPSWVLMHWFETLRYNRETARLEFRFSKDVKPLLLQVKKAYVQLQAKPIMGFKGKYTYRFLFFFTEWEKKGTKTISIADLKDQFQIVNKYAKPHDFHKKVVEPSLKEINKLTDYIVTSELIRTGRSYTHYKFTIKKDKDRKDIVNLFTDDEKQNLYNKLVDYGLTQAFVQQYVAARTVKDINSNLRYAEEHRAGKTNWTGYLRTCLEADYGVKGLFEQEKKAESDYYKLTPEQRNKRDELKKQTAAFVEQQKAAEESAKIIKPADTEVAMAGLQEVKKRLQAQRTRLDGK